MPQLNLPAPEALSGLLYRVLAGSADPAEAGLSRRGLEQLQDERTTLMQEVSSLRAEVEILAAQAAKARHAANQARLDVELFERQAPPPPKRGLLKRKGTPEQQAAQQQRARLNALAAREAEDFALIANQEAAQRQALSQLETMLEHLQVQRARQARQMQEQLAARVLNLAAAGQSAEALRLLDETRQLVRGDMMAAALAVMVALLNGGLDAALPVLGQFRTVFSQQGESVGRVLSALLAVTRGRPLKRQELGLLPAENLPTPAFLRLYQLVRVLAGWDYDEAALGGHPGADLLFFISEYISDGRHTGQAGTDQARDRRASLELAARAAESSDLIVRAIAALLLLRRGEPELVRQAAGIDPAAIPPPQGRRGAWPRLWELLGEPPAAWPAALDAPWRAVLACLVLLTARDAAAPELFAAWLAESYNWPKSDFYWWTLAELKGDRALLTNLTQDPGQLVGVAPV